jgi:hypothetical protein
MSYIESELVCAGTPEQIYSCSSSTLCGSIDPTDDTYNSAAMTKQILDPHSDVVYEPTWELMDIDSYSVRTVAVIPLDTDECIPYIYGFQYFKEQLIC